MKLYTAFLLSTIIPGFFNAAAGQNISGVVNSYHKVTAINTTTNTLTLSSAAGLSPGVKVLIIQMKGATIDNSNSASFGNVTAIGNAGNYEFNYVCGVNGNDVILMYTLLKTYTVSGMVQLVTVPQYTAAIVTDTLMPAPWNATTGTGGVLAIEASSSITLTRPIDASGKGFKGGAYLDHPQPPYNCDFATNITAYGFSNPASGYQTGGSKGEGITNNTGIECGKGKLANGGGGANNHNSGGAGGANFGAGGLGGQRSNEGTFNCHGQNPGIGGLSLSGLGYSTGNNRVFMGGGGGAGHGNNNVGMPGGDGGGLIFIKTDILYGNNELIRANGARPYRADLADPYSAGGDGGGGGGGAGAIIADVNTYTGTVNYEARGADGSYSSYTPSPGCFGPGGGGGGGMLWIKQASLPGGVTTNFSGGVNGLVSVTASIAACQGSANGATPGASGNYVVNYVPPVSTSPVCIPLPLNDLIYFVGKETAEGVTLNWKMRNPALNYSIERSVDKVRFSTIAQVQDYDYIDENPPAEFVYYRLKISYADGRKLYSSTILIQVKSKSEYQLLRVLPNPLIRCGKQGIAELNVYNAGAQKLFSRRSIVHKGLNQLPLTGNLPRGAYFLVIAIDGRKLAASFIKE
jgi:hypothetical protein